MANTTGLRPLADKVLDGQLDDLLRTCIADGLSVEATTRTLWGRGVTVSRETVRKWLRTVN